MPSQKGQGGELNKTKKPGNDSKGSGQTSKPKEVKQQGKTTPGIRGTQSSESSGACGTNADEIPSKRSSQVDDPTKRTIHQRGRSKGKPPHEGTKVKQATSSTNGKVNPDRGTWMEPKKEGTAKTVRRTQSSDTQGANGPSASRPNSEGNDSTKQNTGRRDRWRGKLREGTKNKLQAISNEKGNTNSDRETTLNPNKGATQKSVRGRSQSSDSQVAAEPPANRSNSTGEISNKQKKGDPKGCHKGISKEGDTGKQPTTSTGKRKPSGKKQDHPPGNPTNRNATSETQSSTCRPHKGDKKKSTPRGGYVLNLKTLKEKDCTEVVQTLNDNMALLNDFLESEKEEHNSDDFIFDLSCTLAIACDAPATETTNKILAALKGSPFFRSKLPCLLDRVQKAKTAICDPESQRRLVEWLIKIFNKYLMHLPSSYADPPYVPLRETLEQANIDGKDDLKKQLDDFKQRRDDIIKAVREKPESRYTKKAEQKQLNDFREIPICPTNTEIKSQEEVYLRENIKKGRYEDVEHYLDVQFRLLREDFLAPLREGINEITHNIPRAQRNQLIKCYQGVRIVGKELKPSGIIHNVEFDASKFPLTRWAHSKRLMFGSFLCFSKDNFETMLFATVANRDPEALQKGTFGIQFIEEQNIFDLEKRQQEYQMVESPAFFEAYRHVLKGLKGLNEDTMPFTKYLVECSAEVEPPEYLLREDNQDPVYYDLSKALGVRNRLTASQVPVLKPEAWPSAVSLRLNQSQLEALRTAVTTEFSVIQGPPGTGKTYVGAKIVRCLLENREQWDPERVSPMLMVCYTNHALDQFLEKVLEFLPKREIIRVGGRSKSEELKDCNVKEFTKKYARNYARSYKRDQMEANAEQMALEIKCRENDLCKADRVLLELQDLEGCMTAKQADQFYRAAFPHNAKRECQNPRNTFKLWLCNNPEMNKFNKHSSVLLNEGHDGSILQGDDAGEDDGLLHQATGARFDVSSNSHYFQDESEEDERKENTAMEKVSRKKGTGSENVGWEPTVHEDLPSSNQPTEQSNILKALHECLVDDSHLSASKETEKSIAAKQLEEKSQLLKVDSESYPFNESPKTAKDGSKDVFKLHETDEETIAVEVEAAWIQNQRSIEGEEEDTLVKLQHYDREKFKERNDGDAIKGTEAWQTDSHQKKAEQFIWKQEEGGTTKKESKVGQYVEQENSQMRGTAWIQGQTCIDCKEESTLMKLQQSDRGNCGEENDEVVTKNTREWKVVTHQKKTKQFVWKKEESGTANKEGQRGQFVEAENTQKRDTATKKGKNKKKKKKKNEINLTAYTGYIKKQLQKEVMMPNDEAMKVGNIWNLSDKDRLRLYLHWVECYREMNKNIKSSVLNWKKFKPKTRKKSYAVQQ